MPLRLVVPRSAPAELQPLTDDRTDLADGTVRLRVDRFGLSSNNVSYALYGDMLGYWAFFPVDDEHGCIPVWGFAEVTETKHDQLPVGARVFGYLPMGEELIVTPADVTDLAFSDASAHRSDSHPWYNRYYLCSADPVWSPDDEAMQMTMWALFMTGWALAIDLAASARTVVVSSASSKTALALAWTLAHDDRNVAVVGVTSAGNRGFVEATGVYDRVATYDDLDLSSAEGPAAFVDAAGSPGIKERIHIALGERLTDSVGLGATHQGAGEATGELVGPPPRFFFIPDVAEQRAATETLAGYHAAFADAWHRFRPFIDGLLTVDGCSGLDDIVTTYREIFAGHVGPEVAKVLSW